MNQANRKNTNNWLKAASTLANVDNITTAFSKGVEKLQMTTANKLLGSGEIAASGLALLCLLVALCKCEDRSKLPQLWMGLIAISCATAIVGSALVLSDIEESQDTYLIGSFLIGFSKIFHPLVTSVIDSDGPIEENETAADDGNCLVAR